MEINWLSIVLAAFTPILIGLVWYHPKAFGEAWRQSFGMSEQRIRQGNKAMILGLAYLIALLISFYLFTDINWGAGESHHGEAAYQTFKHGAWHGTFLSVLVVFPIVLINALFEQKNFKYIFINAGYWLITLIIMGGIVGTWH